MAKQIEEDFYEEFQLEHVKKQPKYERHGRCEKCLYWQPLRNGFPSAENNVRGRKGDNIGECRYNAPGVGNLDVLWPVTYEFDWCGQFKAQAGVGGLAAL
jgi:hypothetical protein